MTIRPFVPTLLIGAAPETQDFLDIVCPIKEDKLEATRSQSLQWFWQFRAKPVNRRARSEDCRQHRDKRPLL